MIISQCAYCQHFSKSGANTCAAFPEGIPENILLNEISHKKRIPGDHGITFEAVPGASPSELKFKFSKLMNDVVA